MHTTAGTNCNNICSLLHTALIFALNPSADNQCVHNALELVLGISQLIIYSPKCSSLFDTLKSQVSPGVPTLKPLCPTRWTVRTHAIGALLTNYELLLDALEIIKGGKGLICHESQWLFDQYATI